ncbi:MAG: tetratricopeptide repeat protein [Candidatus Omnitrophota bacterium]|nr:tetratricopeptide repeat protein [Candidatus Omnitrophota bacterium]
MTNPRTAFLLFFLSPLLNPFAFSAEPQLTDTIAYDRAIQLKAEGQFLESERMFYRAIELKPDNPYYHFELSNLYALRYDLLKQPSLDADGKQLMESSARELEQASMMHPSFLEAHYNLGVVYRRLGEFEKAREEFKQVLVLDPTLAGPYMQMGEIYETQGFFDEARDMYLKARDLDYHNPDIHGAIEELTEHKEIFKQRQRTRDAASDWGRRSRGFEYSPNSQANQYGNEQYGSSSQGQSIQAAAPYIGMMLVQEFMRLRERMKGE